MKYLIAIGLAVLLVVAVVVAQNQSYSGSTTAWRLGSKLTFDSTVTLGNEQGVWSIPSDDLSYLTNGAFLTNGAAIGAPQLWKTNAADGSITNVNGGGVNVSQGLIKWPFIGYGGAAATGVIYQAVAFGNSSNNAVQLVYSYQNNTNSDGSINTVFRRGLNMAPNSGVVIPGIGMIGEQMEFHYDNNGILQKEWHKVLAGTNNVETRFESSSFQETNGNTFISYGAESVTWGPHTNPPITGVQWNLEYVGGLPFYQMSLNNGSFFHETYPNGSGVILQCDDSTSTSHNVFQWSPTCGGTGCLDIAPNGDIASVQINTPVYILSGNPIGQANNPSFCPGYVLSQSVSAGGFQNPGNGNITATNIVSARQSAQVGQLVLTNGFFSQTNVWSGPTNTLDISIYNQGYSTLTPLAITGFINSSNSLGAEVKLKIKNIASTNVTIYFTASGDVDRDHVTSQTITNGTVAQIWYNVDPGEGGSTNHVFNDF